MIIKHIVAFPKLMQNVSLFLCCLFSPPPPRSFSTAFLQMKFFCINRWTWKVNARDFCPLSFLAGRSDNIIVLVSFRVILNLTWKKQWKEGGEDGGIEMGQMKSCNLRYIENCLLFICDCFSAVIWMHFPPKLSLLLLLLLMWKVFRGRLQIELRKTVN